MAGHHDDQHELNGQQRAENGCADPQQTVGSEEESGGLVRVVDSETILAGHREVWIRHGQAMYRLRLTASGRLYLSK